MSVYMHLALTLPSTILVVLLFFYAKEFEKRSQRLREILFSPPKEPKYPPEVQKAIEAGEQFTYKFRPEDAVSIPRYVIGRRQPLKPAREFIVPFKTPPGYQIRRVFGADHVKFVPTLKGDPS